MGRSHLSEGRQRLVDATLACLARDGYHRSSVRRIAETAGVTAGLLRYYFGGKDELLLEAYRHFKRSALHAYLDEAASAGPDPAGQLEAFVRSVLFVNAADRNQMNIWISFLELVITDADISAAQAENYDRFLQALSDWIRAIYVDRGEQLTPASVRKLAIGVNSVIDGLWMECSLNPSRMTPHEALEIALDMIGGKLDLCFAELG